MGSTNLRTKSSEDTNRRFEKKLQFYAKVKDTVASLSARKAINKKKRIRRRQKRSKAYNLSSLSEFLPELKAPRQQTAADLKLNGKSRQKLVLHEGKQLKTVLSHPEFQKDLMAAIRQHLESTQPVMDEKPEKRRSRTGKKKVRGMKQKPSSGPQTMDL